MPQITILFYEQKSKDLLLIAGTIYISSVVLCTVVNAIETSLTLARGAHLILLVSSDIDVVKVQPLLPSSLILEVLAVFGAHA